MSNLQTRYHCDACEMISDHRENFPHKMDCIHYVPKDPVDYESIIKIMGGYFYEDEITLGQSLLKLLLGVMKQGEGFSGKHPFGNSGWEWIHIEELVKSGFIKGELTDEGDLEILSGGLGKTDEEKAMRDREYQRILFEAARIIKGVIKHIFAKAGIE